MLRAREVSRHGRVLAEVGEGFVHRVLRLRDVGIERELDLEREHTWTWGELHEVPSSEFRGDIHCVTTWSKLDTSFAGVSLDVLFEVAKPAAGASHVLATSTTGYTTNLPLGSLTGGQAWIVWSHEGRPLPAEHGGPVRLLVPHLYFWKSAKWVTRLTLLDHDQQGFWERNGYHDLGDPWREQRYQGD